MFNLAFHKRTKEEAKAALRQAAAEHDDDALTAPLEAALENFLEAMPDVPEGGSMLVSVSANTPLGGYGVSYRVEVAFHEEDLTHVTYGNKVSKAAPVS